MVVAPFSYVKTFFCPNKFTKLLATRVKTLCKRRPSISALLNHTPGGRETKGLFTWREEDPSTRKILEGGITLRWVYMKKFRPVSCPSREG